MFDLYRVDHDLDGRVLPAGGCRLEGLAAAIMGRSSVGSFRNRAVFPICPGGPGMPSEIDEVLLGSGYLGQITASFGHGKPLLECFEDRERI